MDVLDPRTRVKVDELARRIWVSTDQRGTRAVRSALEEAISEQQGVRIRYTAEDGNKTTRAVEPVIFASTNGHWYLIGWCQLRNEMRWLRVSRIEHTTATKTRCGTHGVEESGIPPATSSLDFS
ncbi:helix-turn-helix transcriptional regulator [Pseudarthrobacter sp. So.54]